MYARYTAANAGITSIAVLPLRNSSNDPEQDYLSDGISEALINRLSQLPGLKVVANSSSSRYKGQNADPQEVARALDVTGILAGRVSQRGDSLSISVELIDGRDRTQVWGEQYVSKAADLFQVSADISRDVAAKLLVHPAAGQPRSPGTHEMRNPEAYELLLKGHFHRAKGGTEDRQKAADYFARAIAADPGYALAHADLSDIYRSLVNSGLLDRNEYLPKARAAAQKALELDDGLADGHYALANLMTYAWEWADAEREYKRAIELNPNLALAHRWYAAYLRLMGRHEQAITEISRARELDPLSPGVNATVGYVLSSARRYDQAISCVEQDDRSGPEVSLRAPLLRSHVCRTGQVRGGRCCVHEGDRARSRYACHADLSGCGVRACGRSHACAGGPPAVAIEQGARVSSGAGDPADGAGRAGAGIRLARAGVSRTRYSAAVPGRGAGTRSATLGPTLCGPGATRRSCAMSNDPLTPVPADEAGRILLVDDEATNLHVLRETLTGPNYRLFVARSGEEALKVARRAQPSLVLLDVVMPGIDGYETCRRLKEDPDTRDAAVIFLSALNDPKDRVRGFEAGAVDFISKPVQAEEVIARVNTHLTIQRLLRRQVEAASPGASDGSAR